MDNSSVKKNIYHFRKAKGFTQEEMASRIGTSVTHYRNIESGKTWLVSPVVGRIAGALGIGEDELLTGDGTGRSSLEDEPASYGSSAADREIVQLRAQLSDSREREADFRERIDEMSLYIKDLRSTIEILKRARGFENPEKI